MAWQNLILLEKILMVESSQMRGLKYEKNHWPNMVKIEWFKLKYKRMKWGENVAFLMCNNLLHFLKMEFQTLKWWF